MVALCSICVVTAHMQDLYEIGPLLGSGRYGKVYSAHSKETGQAVYYPVYAIYFKATTSGINWI